jgi:catechol 2,3-dioxygenase-like lactoylglutathione lyase family enzyme
MRPESPAKVKFTRLLQVVLFVKDLKQTMDDYWKFLGIGPWDIYDWEAPLVYDLKHRDRPAQARERLAFATVGNLELEVIEHLDGDSFYTDYIKEHGEGAHQLDFDVRDVDQVSDTLVKEGFTRLQSGRFGDNGAYAIMDLKPLHVTWEPCRMADNMGKEPIHYRSQEQSLARVKVTGINTISFAVKDLTQTMESYWRVLGIGPWEVYDWGTPLIYDFEFRGKAAQPAEKMAVTQLGENLYLELYQPMGRDSCFWEFLNGCGEGIHHLGFAVPDVDDAIKNMNEQGFTCLQRGRFGDNGAFAYMHLKPLHVTWEVYRDPENWGVEPTRYP